MLHWNISVLLNDISESSIQLELQVLFWVAYSQMYLEPHFQEKEKTLRFQFGIIDVIFVLGLFIFISGFFHLFMNSIVDSCSHSKRKDMTVCYYHVTYAFQTESTLCSYLNVKERLARSRHEIWSLSDCNWARTHSHLVHKQTLNHLAKLASVKLVSVRLWTKWLWFESSCRKDMGVVSSVHLV